MPQGERTSVDTLTGDDGASFSGAAAELILGTLTDIRRDQKIRTPRIPWTACHPVPVAIGQPIPITAGAGTLGVTQDIFGPNDPYWWDVRSLAAWGFTAGTIIAYRNQIGGEQLAVWTSAGEFTWGAQKMLGPRDSIIWSASGISGTPQVAGQAIEVEAAWLAEYLV